MKKKQIIWDWNGTLLDDVEAAVRALNRMLVARKLPTLTPDFYRAHFGFPVRPFYSLIGMDPDREWDRICVEFHENLHDELQHIRPDAKAALEFVREQAIPQSILSALRQDLLLRDTTAEGVRGFFREIYGVDNLDGATKLSRGRDLLARIGTPDTVFYLIGDTLHDAEVATALGATPILVAGGHQATDRLQAAGFTVVATLLDAVRGVVSAN